MNNMLSMNRRTFLSVASGVMVTPHALNSTTSSDNEENSDWCASISDNASQLANPSGEPDFIVSGEKDVEVYWKPQEYFDERGYFFSYAVSNVGGSLITLNKGRRAEINDYVLTHELAHSLGYRHGDGGIVNTDTALSDTGDRTGDTLEESTKDVGNSFDAYEVYERWDVGVLGDLGVEFAQDNLLVTELGKAGQRFASNSSVEDIHIRNSHNGFGGKYDSGPQPKSKNVYAGRFYK
jgi:hypothetical protein